MTRLIESIAWGFIQGISEFIPVSSSGHLVVIPRLIGIEAPDIIFNIYLNTGTLIAVLIFFRRDIAELFRTRSKVILRIALATLPLAACGLIFADRIKTLFNDPRSVGWILVINGFILFMGHLKLSRVDGESKPVGVVRTLAIGVAQALALLPGLSRSGMTIIAGVYSGFKREDAYRFSFMLFIPASLLALAYSVKEASITGHTFEPSFLAGAAVSAAVGILALKFLLSLLKSARLYMLGFYCIGLGALVLYLF